MERSGCRLAGCGCAAIAAVLFVVAAIAMIGYIFGVGAGS